MNARLVLAMLLCAACNRHQSQFLTDGKCHACNDTNGQPHSAQLFVIAPFAAHAKTFDEGLALLKGKDSTAMGGFHYDCQPGAETKGEVAFTPGPPPPMQKLGDSFICDFPVQNSCEGTVKDLQDAKVTADGAIFFQGDDHVFVPCASMGGISSYQDAVTKLDKEHVVHFSGHHDMRGFVLTHKP